MLGVLPMGALHSPWIGIQDDLADHAKRLGIPVREFGGS